MTNHLANQNSPYLLQHASNPVDWYPWGEEALTRARSQEKPIFLSIGYAACHWCHVMAHESFEDSETAALLNQDFVPIKVDREERPDLDGIYMQATMAMTGSGGWPMSVFLTPDLKPFFAGTYFPDARRHGLPAFREVLSAVAKAWREDRENLEQVASKVAQSLRNLPDTASTRPLRAQDLEGATTHLLDAYDWEHGGWGSAPKFPQPMAIEYLLRRATNFEGASTPFRAAAHALAAMARGGMCDVVGGGFSRYSTDVQWRVPHFEKMLYDNAQLSRAYLHAWQTSGDPAFKRVCIETLDFVLRELLSPDGGFYSSLDADSEGREGAYYVWTLEQIRSAIADPGLFQLFSLAYGVTDRGNWDGHTVLQRAIDDATLAARLDLTAAQVQALLPICHQRLLAARSSRPRPATDDKVLTSWNGLMLRALANAAATIDDASRSQSYRMAATRNAAFLVDQLRPSGRLRHVWRAGNTGDEAFLEDFAGLALGLLELYQTTFENRWFQAARELATEMLDRFSDPLGGFFDTPRDGAPLLLRPEELQDGATPSGNSMAVEALLILSELDDSGRFRSAADLALARVADSAVAHPLAFANWLCAADRALGVGPQIAVLYPPATRPDSLLGVIRKGFRPNAVVAGSAFPPEPGSPTLLHDRNPLSEQATAFVCHDFVCRLPTTSPDELVTQL